MKDKKVLIGYLNERENNKKNFLIRLFLSFFAVFFGFALKDTKNVKADETNGLMDNYTLYALELNDDALDAIEGDSLSMTIDDTNFVGLDKCYLLSTKCVLTNIIEISFGNDLTASIMISDDELVADGFDIYFDYVDFTFRYMENAKAFMVPNMYSAGFDELLIEYSFANSEPVYPLGELFTKVTESSEQYILIDAIVPFNEILHLGTNWYIYYYGSFNQGYNEGLEDGYNNALELQNGELPYMARLVNTVVHGLRSILNTKILGQLTVGNFVFVPIFLGVLILLWKMIGKG